MFLSDILEAIYNDSKQFDIDTCNKIIYAICDKCKNEISVLRDVAKKRGSINSNAVYSAFKQQETTFNQFCKKHSEVPQALIDKVKEIIENFNQLVDKAVGNSNHRLR